MLFDPKLIYFYWPLFQVVYASNHANEGERKEDLLTYSRCNQGNKKINKTVHVC